MSEMDICLNFIFRKYENKHKLVPKYFKHIQLPKYIEHKVERVGPRYSCWYASKQKLSTKLR